MTRFFGEGFHALLATTRSVGVAAPVLTQQEIETKGRDNAHLAPAPGLQVSSHCLIVAVHRVKADVGEQPEQGVIAATATVDSLGRGVGVGEHDLT